MKTSIWHSPQALLTAFGLLSALSIFAYGQSPTATQGTPISQSDTGSSTPPESTTSTAVCAHTPCTSVATGRRSTAPPPGPIQFTAAQLEEMRYMRLFSEIEAQERMAEQEGAAGHSDAAASWRGYFAKHSGLTQEDAETVKKIASDYKPKWEALQSKLRAANLAVRPVKGRDPIGYKGSTEYAALLAVNQERDSLFPRVKAELISALGSRSFSRLDSYTLHPRGNTITAPKEGSSTAPSSTTIGEK